MNTSNNVFVFCPTYQENGVDQVHDLTLESIKNMRGDFTFHLGRYNPFPARNHHNILVQYRTARTLMLEAGFDYLMTIEHDMIVPPDALEKLLALDVPVAYGLYLFRHNSNVVNAFRHVKAPNPDFSLSIYPDELAQAIAAETPEVSGAGMGCLLIKREVLEVLDFHGKEGCDSDIPDVEFATDCMREGFKQVCHFGVKCGHIEQGGRILYPLNGGKAMNEVNVKILQSVNVEIGGRTVALKAGAEMEIPEPTAKELARAGYVSIVSKRKTRKTSTKTVNPPAKKGLTTKSLKGK